MVANKVVKVVVVAEVEDIKNLTIEMEIMTKIILMERVKLLNLKTSHTCNVLYVKGMNTISQNVK